MTCTLSRSRLLGSRRGLLDMRLLQVGGRLKGEFH